MSTDGLEQQLPINAVEEALDVEIENPIVAPAALASLAHGINRRFAGPVAIGIGVEHRLQDRLQIATGDLLGNAVRDSWNPQRPRPPSAFGISTRNTGGGNSPPDDSRCQSLCRLCPRSPSTSAIDCPSPPAVPWFAFTRLKAPQ